MGGKWELAWLRHSSGTRDDSGPTTPRDVSSRMESLLYEIVNRAKHKEDSRLRGARELLAVSLETAGGDFYQSLPGQSRQLSLASRQADDAVKYRNTGDGVCETRGTGRWTVIVPLAARRVVASLNAVASVASRPAKDDLISLPASLHHDGHTGQHDRSVGTSVGEGFTVRGYRH